MTTAEVRSMAREYARMSSAGKTDTGVNGLITQAQTQFAREVYGFPADDYLTVTAYFDMDTKMAFNLTISGSTNNDIAATDVAVTATDYDDKSGASAAAILQTQIRTAIGTGADATVTWNDFYFTVSAIDTGASIVITSPTADTYSDATTRFFGGVQSGTTSIVCDFPEDCTTYADLPTDFYIMTYCSWDKDELRELPRRLTVQTETTGTPIYYSVVDKRLYLYPVPTEQKELYIEYKSVPTTAVGTAIDSHIPAECHQGLAYLVAAEMLKQTFEEQQAKARFADYYRVKAQYLNRVQNNATESDAPMPGRRTWPWYKVVT